MHSLPIRIAVLFLMIAVLPTVTLSGVERSTNSALPGLITQPKQRRLHLESYWHVLLHYQSHGFGWISEVDDPGFFLAPDGKTDPEAELTAALSAFLMPVIDPEEDADPRCRFPARFAWLAENLDLAEAQTPDCPQYRRWEKDIDAGSVTLVFPNYYIDAPASMFGHTLLRINGTDPERPALLNYAVNYAALVDDEEISPLVYGFKGVFGGFHGVFTVAPYYISVRSYNDMEQRDIWEYDLALTPRETQRMMRHLWELKHTWFDYYFFRENCSYHLLSLLESARPGLNLRNRFSVWTIPSDTLRSIDAHPGLIVRRTYRPSRWSRVRQQLTAMSRMEQGLALSFMRSGSLSFTDQWDDLPRESRARILELLAEYHALNPFEQSGTLRDQAMLKRAELGMIPPPDPSPPTATAPETGHGTIMASISSGRVESGPAFTGLSLRPSLHDLLDRESGYIPNHRISFLHARFRQYTDQDDPRLQELTLADITSLNARNAIHSGFSWKLNSGWVSVDDPSCEGCLVFQLNVGGGLGLSAPGGLIYSLGEFRYGHGADLPPAGHAALGLTMGYLAGHDSLLRGHLESTISYPAYDGNLPDLRQEAGLSLNPFQNHSLRFSYKRVNRMAEYETAYRFFF